MNELDVDKLAGLFFGAAETERKLPAVVRKQTRAAWPDYPDSHEAYGWTDEEVRLGPASAKEIADYELALELTWLMDDDDRRVVWATAHSAARRLRGPRWKVLGRIMGCSGVTAKRRFERAIFSLWARLEYEPQIPVS